MSATEPLQEKMRRLETGVPGLDKVLAGGVPKGAVVMVLAPPGSGKTIFSKQFLYQGLIQDQVSILLSTGEAYETVLENMKSFEWNSNYGDKLIYSDCYSWRLGKSESRYSSSPANLSDVSIMLNQILSDYKISPTRPSRLVIDSYSDFLMNAGQDLAVRFLGTVKARLFANRITTLIIVEAGLHDEKTVSAIEYISDGTLKMTADEKGRFLMVSRMAATPSEIKWVPFVIRKGIEVKMTEFLQ